MTISAAISTGGCVVFLQRWLSLSARTLVATRPHESQVYVVILLLALERFPTLQSTINPERDLITADFSWWCPKSGGRVRRRVERNVAVSTRDRNRGKTTTEANRPLLARMGRYASALPRIELESIKFRHLARVSTRHATPKNQLRQLEAGLGELERGSSVWPKTAVLIVANGLATTASARYSSASLPTGTSGTSRRTR